MKIKKLSVLLNQKGIHKTIEEYKYTATLTDFLLVPMTKGKGRGSQKAKIPKDSLLKPCSNSIKGLSASAQVYTWYFEKDEERAENAVYARLKNDIASRAKEVSNLIEALITHVEKNN